MREDSGKGSILKTAFTLDDFRGLGRRKTWRLISIFFSEFFATAITLFLGCSTVQSMLFGPQQNHLAVVIAFGFAVGTSVMCFGHISGSHINPALSVASVIVGDMSIFVATFYAVAQCSGATFGYALTRAILPSLPAVDENDAYFIGRCCTLPNGNLEIWQAIFAEFLGTGILTWAACHAWDKRNSDKHDSMPIKFAVVIVALAMPLALYSGCSVNPARSFGPALYNNFWTKHYVYWVGPISGSVVTAIIYRIIFNPAHMQVASGSKRDPASLTLRNNSLKADDDV